MRRPKLLVCLVTVALALSALFGASTASASIPATFAAEEFPAQLNGVPTYNEGVYSHSWASAGQQFSCEPKSFWTPTEDGSEVRPTMEDYGCYLMQVEMKGCTYIFHPTPESAGEGMYKGRLDIGNAPGKTCYGITLKNEFRKCTWTVGPVSNLSGLTIKEVSGATGYLELSLKTNVPAKGDGKAGCPTGNLYHTGTWDLKAYQYKGPKEAGAQIGLTVDPGEEFAENFEASSYPYEFEGTSGSIEFKSTFFKSIACTMSEESEYSELFKGTLSAPSATVSAQPTLSGCVDGFSRPVEVKPHSCSYVFGLTYGSYPFTGSADLSCSKGGDTLDFVVYPKEGGPPKCVMSIAPQSGLKGITYENSGYHGASSATLNLEGIKVTRTEGTLLSCGGASQTWSQTGTIGFGFWVG